MTKREKVREIIFGTETPGGKAFDVILIIAILISVGAVMLASIEGLQKKYGDLFRVIEWGVTILFTLEYILRLYSALKWSRYIFSFFGVVDLLAILPTYVSLILPGSHQHLLAIRVFRMLRVFRVFGLGAFMKETRYLLAAIRLSGRRILVFLLAVFTIVVTMGSVMYVVESPGAGFTSIPRSVYWAIVTLTTVGYGDISPQTSLGQTISSIIMILGYSLIVVPTGFISAAAATVSSATKRECPACNKTGHDEDARFCNRCGGAI